MGGGERACPGDASAGILHSHAPLMADVTVDGGGVGGAASARPLSPRGGELGVEGGRDQMRPTGDLTRLRADSEIKIWPRRDVDSLAGIEQCKYRPVCGT